MEVTVWMVAMAFWGAPLRGMLEGTIEQVAKSAGVMGVQLRTTVPAEVVERGEGEVVGGGTAAGDGGGGGGGAVDGEGEGSVDDAGSGEGDECRVRWWRSW